MLLGRLRRKPKAQMSRLGRLLTYHLARAGVFLRESVR